MRARRARFAGALFAFSTAASCAPSPTPPPAPPPAPPVAGCPSTAPSPPPSPSAASLAEPQADASAPPRHTFVDAEERALPRDASGRDYVVYVFLPESYATHPERRYPVLYLCDGYWDGPLVRTVYWNLTYDKTVPEFILIGFGYPGEHADYGKLRLWDYTPAVEAVPDGGAPDTGHAPEFLDLVEHTIIPLVEHDYRTDPAYRALGGSSLGGLFTLYALFAKPGLFQAYIAASPAVGFASDWLFRYEAAFARSPAAHDLHARLFVTGADHERPLFFGAIQRFNAQMRAHAYPALNYQYRVVDGEHHAGTKGESYSRGLRFAFAPLLPPEH